MGIFTNKREARPWERITLNRQLGDEVFHPTTLVNFRQRLLDHDLSRLGFETVMEALKQLLGWAKVKLRNYFIGAAGNVKRWPRREAWKLHQGLSAAVAQAAALADH